MSCTGKRCGFNINVTKQDAGCSEGDGSCFEAMLLTAERSKFHDEKLMEATERIQDVLAQIGRDPLGLNRKVSFINTNMGLVLAWVQHGKKPQPGSITDKDTDADIGAALNLPGYKTTKAQGETAP